MKTPLKKLSIFGLAAGIGNAIQDQSIDDRIKYRAKLLAESAEAAIEDCDATVNKSRLKQVEKKN